jgi:hypothetical protein
MVEVKSTKTAIFCVVLKNDLPPSLKGDP